MPDAAQDAYNRLIWAQTNRPDAETLARMERERKASEQSRKIKRLRASVA